MQTGRDVAGSHREASGKAAVAELLTGQGAVAELLTGSEVVQHHREENTGKDASTEEQLRDACRV